MFLLLLSLVEVLVFIGSVNGGPHEERLIKEIFQERHYEPLSRPVTKESNAVNVIFGLSLQQIITVDEKNENIQTNMWLNYEWTDYKLTWNKSDYGGVESIRLPSSKIWNPDILLYNSADEDIDSKYPTNIVVYANGTCSWVPIGLYISTCSINIRWFPFDDQICEMKFGSWSYDESKINLTSKADTIDLSTYTESGEWEIIKVSATRNEEKYECCAEPYIDITFKMHIRRRALYYGFNLIIPCALISMLTLLTFILPPGEGEKIGLGITILLSLSVFQMIVADMVPATSMAVPIVGVYFACVTIMCTMSVIMTVLVLNYHHRSPDMYSMHPWVKLIICEWLAWLLHISRPGHDLSSREAIARRSRLRRLQARNPPSESLIANVKDADAPGAGGATYYVPRSRPSMGTPDALRSTISYDGRHGSSPSNCRRGNMPNGRHDSPYDNGRRGNACDGRHGNDVCRTEEMLARLLNELRIITNKMKTDAEEAAETNDWKFAAMVIDRLCFWTFSIYLIFITFVLFLAPYVSDRT